MRLGFASPDDMARILVDREDDGAVSRGATQRARRGPWDHPAKAVDQPHIAADNQQVSFDKRRVARALDDRARHREIAHIVLSPDQLPGEAIQFRQEAGHVIEVEKPTVDGRSGRDAALGTTCRSGIGYRLVDPLDRELTHGRFVDRPALETPGIEVNSLRECRNLHRQQQQGETLPALHGGKAEHECLRGHVEECCKGSWRRRAANYVPWVRGCVSANACMNGYKSILLFAGPRCAVHRGERVRLADQSRHTNDPTKFGCPQAKSEHRGATKIGALRADAPARVKMASPTGFEPVLPP